MKKGFLFTVTIFLILTYILLSISIWVKSVETEERAYAEFYRESALELALEQLTPGKMSNVSDIVMLRSLFRLNMHAIDHPVSAVNGDENIRQVMHSLLINGSADGSYFLGGTGIDQERSSSLAGWLGNLNASLIGIGIQISEFRIENFQFYMYDYRTLRYSYDLTISMSDYAGTTSLSRTYNLADDIDLSGFVDAASSRRSEEIAGSEYQMYRQFFFGPYTDYADVHPSRIRGVDEGQGWYYGYLVDVGDAAAIPNYMRHNYILVGDFTPITQLTDYGYFGAYILTNEPLTNPPVCGGIDDQQNTFNAISWEQVGPDCVAELRTATATDRPFVIADGFDISDAPDCPELWTIGTGNTGFGRCALIMAEYNPEEVRNDLTRKLDLPSEAGIYDIEDARDFLMCGYYMPDPEGPSYFQRLMPDSFNTSGGSLGISTLVIGEYANSTDYDLYSRLDRELFADPPVPSGGGIKVRGFTGCKNLEMCSDEPSTAIFALTQDAIDIFGLEDIACNNGLAGCD